MACYFPWSKGGAAAMSRPLSCGQCIGCKLKRSSEWAGRVMHHASMFDSNAFVLLTYGDKCPFSLQHRDYQLFMKRLRRAYDDKRIGFFMSGEYGTPSRDNGFTFRPHYHTILFNMHFEDRKYFKKSESGHKLYRSRILEKLWPHGHATIGNVTFDSAAYIARYCTKKVTCPGTVNLYEDIDLETGEIRTRVPEYGRMSLRPAIGLEWFEKFQRDVYPSGNVIINGRETRAPRFYDKKWKEKGFKQKVALEKLRAEERAKLPRDDAPDRLKAKEQVARARLALFK